jgi:hypothetical protein
VARQAQLAAAARAGAYVAEPDSLRFHSGACGTFSAACGVWQNTQICVSLVALTVPGPVAERLWRVLETSGTFAACAGSGPSTTSTSIDSAASAGRTNCMTARSIQRPPRNWKTATRPLNMSAT